MKILTISDTESKYYYEYYAPGKLDEFDLIIACGDLKRSYLEFLVTMARCPLIYVHGNHDAAFDLEPSELAVSASMIGFISMMGFGSLALAAPIATGRANICTPSVK